MDERRRSHDDNNMREPSLFAGLFLFFFTVSALLLSLFTMMYILFPRLLTYRTV